MASRVVNIQKLDEILSKIGAYFGTPDLGGGDITFKAPPDDTEDDDTAKVVRDTLFAGNGYSITTILKKFNDHVAASDTAGDKLAEHVCITMSKEVTDPKEIIRAIGGDNPGPKPFGIYAQGGKASGSRTAKEKDPFDIKLMLEGDDGTSETTKRLGRRTLDETIMSAPTGASSIETNVRIAIFEKLSAIAEDSSSLGPAVDFMLNAIPTIERSRCVPYFDIRIIDPLVPVAGGKLHGLSLPRALMGAALVEEDGSDFAHILATAKDLEILGEINSDLQAVPDAAGGEGVTVSGMELFLTPQTLASRGKTSAEGFSTTGLTGGGRRFETILNPFVPLATIVDLKIDIASNVGFVAYEKGTMSLIVHDRSRLGELRSLISPAARGGQQVLLVIDWGWSAPAAVGEGGSNNLFSQFMNMAKRRSVMIVTGQTVSIDSSGQVNVTLSLVSSAANAAGQIEIALGDDKLTKTWAVLDGLLRTVREGLRKWMNASQSAARLQPPVYLTSLSDISGYLQNAKDIEKSLKAFNKTLKKSGDADTKALAASIEKLLKQSLKMGGHSKKTVVITPKNAKKYPKLKVGEVYRRKYYHGASFDKQFADALSEKMDVCLPVYGTRRLDPFLPTIDTGNDTDNKSFFGNKKGITPKMTGVKGDRQQYVSFGKLVSLYIVEPLAASGQFDEIQVVFERFNERASFMCNHSIAEFPVAFAEFKNRFTAQFIPAHGTKAPVTAFADFITNNFTNDQSSPAFGLKQLFTTDKGAGAKVQKKYKDKLLFNTRLEDVMRYAYGDDESTAYVFVVPRVQMFLREITSPDKTKICHLTFKDVQRNTAAVYADIIKLATQDSLGLMQKSITGTDSKTVKIDQAMYQKGMQKAIDQGIIEPLDSDKKDALSSDLNAADLAKINFKQAVSFKALKSFLHDSIPSVHVGSTSSAIRDASFSGAGNKMLEAAALLKSSAPPAAQTTQPSSVSNEPWPVEVMPGKVNITTLGCPFFEIGQDLFIDFMTGTDIDNLYRVMSITHTLSVSGYETQVELINNAGLAKMHSSQNQLMQALDLLEKKAKKKEGA